MSEISIPNTKPNKENCHQKEKYWTEEENIIIIWGDLINNNTIKWIISTATIIKEKGRKSKLNKLFRNAKVNYVEVWNIGKWTSAIKMMELNIFIFIIIIWHYFF